MVIWVCIMLGSCKLPFFIPNKETKEKRARKVERLEKKKEKSSDKVEKKRKKVERSEKKLEKIVSKLPPDTSDINTIDSAALAIEKMRIDSVDISQRLNISAKEFIQKSFIHYRTASFKAKMKYTGTNHKQNFTANFRLIKDSCIWVSIQALSMEVARGYITPERVQAYDRINKNAYNYSFSEIKKLINLDIDFHSLQDIILGNAIAFEGEVYLYDNIGLFQEIGIRDEGYLNKLIYSLTDKKLSQIQLQVFRGSYASSIQALFREYEQVNDRQISTRRIYDIEDSKGKFNLEMDIQNIRLDNEISTPYDVPDNYKLVK